MKRRNASLGTFQLLVAAIALVALTAPAWAGIRAQSPEPPVEAAPSAAPAIHLQAATFVPSAGEGPDLPANLLDEGPALQAAGADGQALVQFAGPILPEWRGALEAAGARVVGYVPDFAYLVDLGGTPAEALRAVEGVIWVGPYHPGYRLSLNALDAGDALLRLELSPDAPLEEVEALSAALPEMGVRLVAQEGNALVVRAAAAALATLARHPQVSWVDRLPAPPRIHNDVATGQVRADRAWNLGYHGDGQMVNVADTGLDSGRDLPQAYGDMHADLDNRVYAISTWPVSSRWAEMLENPYDADDAADRETGHGTHVAGSAVGGGTASGGQYRGVAPRALLTFQALERYCRWKASVGWDAGYYLVGVPDDLNALYAEAHGWGARVHNISWGHNEERLRGAYDASSRQTDEFVHAHRDAVIVVATGNEGRDGDGNGLTDPSSVVPPATAKNVIAVGATETYRPEQTRTYGTFDFLLGRFYDPIAGDAAADAGIDGLAAFGGRGPTLDGRLAPHLVAPGTWIASLRSRVAENAFGWGVINAYDGHYMYYGGTSMSAPQVAGAAALVRQAYAAHAHQPSAALVKATLIQTARDIPGQYPGYDEAGAIPNNNEGWGALDVEAAVRAAATQEFVDETHALNTGQAVSHYFVAGAGSQPARFTLVWTDPPALPSAGKQLVNDLDLEVIDPEGKVYRGVGSPAAGAGPDRVNNAEGVIIAAPVPGVYTVRVRGYNVPLGPQDYVLLANLPARTTAPPVIAVRLPLVARGVRGAAPMPTRTPGPTATPRPTVTPRPTEPTPTPTLAPGEFRDDFSAQSSLWISATTATYAMGYTADEAYAIRVFPAKHKVGSLPGVTGSDDVLLEVTARTTVTTSQAYGLIFNSGEGPGGQEEYHAFLVSPSGWWALMRSEADGDWLEVGWVESPAIATGMAVNRLSVRREGTRVELSINGEMVRAVQGSAYQSGDRFGLVVASWGPDPAEAAFDDVRMLPLEGGAALQVAVDGRAVQGGSELVPPP